MENKFQDMDRHKTSVILILLFLLFCSVIFSIGFGAYDAGLTQIISAIFKETEGFNRSIIWNVRIPRTLVAGLVGISLALAGAILQGVMRNPLASPSTIGITSGAGFMSVVCLVLFPKLEYLMTPMAFLGAFGTTILIYFLSWKDGINPLRMILAGLAISTLLGAFVDLIVILFPDRLQNTVSFSIGSLSARSWKDFYYILPYASVGFAASMMLAKKINILLLGDDVAASLGVSVEKLRLLLIILSSLLAASSVSVIGLVGFVGLIVPHVARLIIGSNYTYLIPASAILGATVLIFCDTIGRILAVPLEIPVGIIMAILGVPFFLYLLRGGIKDARS